MATPSPTPTSAEAQQVASATTTAEETCHTHADGVVGPDMIRTSRRSADSHCPTLPGTLLLNCPTLFQKDSLTVNLSRSNLFLTLDLDPFISFSFSVEHRLIDRLDAERQHIRRDPRRRARAIESNAVNSFQFEQAQFQSVWSMSHNNLAFLRPRESNRV